MKILTGKVVSTKMRNTVTVVVNSMKIHRLYGKRFIRSKKYHVHDEFGLGVGDTVNFTASKPYSKIVRWKTIGSGDKIPKKTQNKQKILVDLKVRQDKKRMQRKVKKL